MKKSVYACICLMLFLTASLVWKTQAVSYQSSVQTADSEQASQDNQMLQTLSQGSELILTGRCLDTRSVWTQNNRVLVTLATIEVGETVKGEAGSTVTVALPGGVDVNRKFPVAMTYPGAPTINQNEEVLLFLNVDDSVADSYAVSGFSDGKFSIIEDERGNKLVSRDFIMGKVATGPGVVRGQRQFVPVAEFKSKIREHLGQ